jgi:hypothetical protein
MTISGSEIARNGSKVENIIFDLLQKLQKSSYNNFTIIGDDEYRKVEGEEFEIYFSEGTVSITVNSITKVSSDKTFEIETIENQYDSKLVEIFFINLIKLLLNVKNISAHNVGFVEAKQ